MTDPTSAPPSSRLKGAVTERIARGPGPLSRLRAGGFGLDRLAGRRPSLELYYEAGDPHSHLCAQLLPMLVERLRMSVRVILVGEPEPALYPEAERQRRFALDDARRIAPAWGLQFPEDARLPTAEARAAATGKLATYAGDDAAAFAHLEAEVSACLWRGEAQQPAREVAALVAPGNARRRRLGHYLPGMWQFGGEWFWGLDRLSHLERRLRTAGLLEGSKPLVCFDARRARLPALPDEPPQLEFFFSFRSPYSYLAAVQMQALQPRLMVPLAIQPVLPMVMRGLKVPPAKRFYIVRDVYREAQALGTPFGRIADPLGTGAERCLATYPLAVRAGHGLDFIAAASRGVEPGCGRGHRPWFAPRLRPGGPGLERGVGGAGRRVESRLRRGQPPGPLRGRSLGRALFPPRRFRHLGAGSVMDG